MISDCEPATFTLQPALDPRPARALRRTFTFSIPSDQAASLAPFVPHEEMHRVRTLLSALEQIHSARKVLPACKALAAGMQRRGWSPQNLRARYYSYISGTDEYPAGDWRILLDKSKVRIDRTAPDTAANRRTSFIELWRKLGEMFHQDWAAAHDELLKIWRTGFDSFGNRYTEIPGYAKWPEADPWLGHPAGWSYAHLMRYQSDPYDQVAARIGHAKASEFRLPVLTTRVGLDFGRFFEFDDHEFNQRVLFQKKPMRPLGFGAVEVLSACVCHIGLKPTLWDFEEEVKRKLTEREFMWFVVALLTHIGYRQDIGTTLIVERGTAAIRSEFETRLARISGGKLTTFVGGRFGKPAHAGQFDGRSKGNFRTKELIEGSWAIIDNQTALLPAQTGRGRDDAPEGFAPGAGAEQYTNRLLKAAERLSPEQASQLQFPYPMYHQWREWAMDAVARVNHDPNHDLEGWDKLGFVQPIWRLPACRAACRAEAPACRAEAPSEGGSEGGWLPWQSFLALPPAQQSVVKAMLDTDPSLLKSHRLSRQAVFDQHRPLLKPMPWELLPELVGPENALNSGADPLTVNSGLFRFQCADIDPDPIEFYARDFRSPAFLPNGEKYTAYVNPYCPTHLVACDAAGKVVAVCPRYIRATKGDDHAVEQLMGAQQSFEAQARVRLNLRHADQAAAKSAMIEHNRRLISGDPRGTKPPVSTRGITQDDFTALECGAAVAPLSHSESGPSSQEAALNEL